MQQVDVATTPAPTPPDPRGALEDLVIRQLLGPWDGPEEIVDEPTVRGRYLVGMLAPRGSSGIPEEYDEGEIAGSDGEDGNADAPAPKAATVMLPSSIGLTFAVVLEATALSVTVRWGRYVRTTVEEERYLRDGNYRRVWQRSPVAVTLPELPLVHGRIGPLPIHPEQEGVTLQGVIRQRESEWIVTLFLVNGQEEPRWNQDSAWLFQPELLVRSPDGRGIFRRNLLVGERPDREDQLTAMLYRNEVEFAVGHGIAVDAVLERDATGRAIPDCATEVRSVVVPTYEVARTSPPTAEDVGFEGLAGLTVDMAALACIPDGQFATHVGPLAESYATWITRQEARLQQPTPDLLPFAEAGHEALQRCRRALERIREGIALLDRNPQAAEAFRFANRAMALQRTRSLYATAVRRGEKQRSPAEFDRPEDHSWRAFQLGFMLINLPALTDPRHPERTLPSEPTDDALAEGIADLLWFPTGGGKTEAYLGLTAYTIAIRRLQGELGGRNGMAGVAVLMRYTLRLLTLQQFQRAAALICACEVIRREEPTRWGSEPFRLGLWVGQRSTPNWVDAANEAIQQLRRGSSASGGTPYQLQHCPWCGTPIDPGRNLVAEPPDRGRGRVLTYCGSLLDQCPFNARHASGEGLPVMVVDEEIYQRLPALLIATVDKFAQMPWNGRVAALFGHVSHYCERHGYLTPDAEHTATGHPAIKQSAHGAARVLAVTVLRPPDLIIQDELHLISGPLGTLVGLYESAVDQLATWELDGVRVRPKVVASTATIRRAEQQVRSLFLRRVAVFPPQGLDAGDNFFALQRPPDATNPGRRYMGIYAPGIRHKTALIQAYIVFLAAAQQLHETLQLQADPYMTLVGYFNALRELAAMRRAVDDSVTTRLTKMGQRGLPARHLDPWRVSELTSRLSAAEIPKMLDRLEVLFDPAQQAKQGAKRSQETNPIDVLLASNMISVGVDVARLGLMIVAGQPKSTAEYIQATSRVGRRHAGLVATIYNWTRPRDLSHYERFKHYHATFYQHVEALSVTPFSPRAIDRGLSGVLVALARLGVHDYNPNLGAGRIDVSNPTFVAARQAIIQRAEAIDGPRRASLLREALNERLEQWHNRIAVTVSARLGYQQRGGDTVGLLTQPGDGEWNLFAALNSLRDVEPSVNLILEDGGLDTGLQPWHYGHAQQPSVASGEDA